MMDESAEDGSGNVAIKLSRLELALRASNEGIWDWWTHQAEIHYSRRILEFLECGADHAPNIFLSPWDHVHEEDRGKFRHALENALRNGGPDTLKTDARLRTGSGGWRWLRICGTVVRDRGGEARRIAGSMIDISLRKQAEAALEEERFQLRQLIDHVPVQIYFKDLDSRFVMANKGMAQWIGLEDAAEIVGKSDREFFDDSHWEPALADERRIIETGAAVSGKLEEETWRDEGAETWVLTSKFPWRDRNGIIKGTFGVSSDVTGLVIARKEAAAMAAELQLKNDAYEEELHLAREIQHALTDRGFPEISDAESRMEFLARYIPISGLAGDFFEVIDLGPQKAGILICDVMGHGVRSALIVAMLRGLLEKQRTLAEEPGHFLHGLNEGLVSILTRARTTMFATAFYAVLDLASGAFSYACAGHPGPVLETTSGEVAQIACEKSSKGPGLGLIPHAKYPTLTRELGDLKRLILFTDGVLEAENPHGEPFFTSRLMETIAEKSGEPLEELLDGILKRILAFSGSGHFDDDVCLLAVELQKTGPPENFPPLHFL